MKKFFALCSMVVALGFVATGCGGGNAPAPASTVPAASDAVEGYTADESEEEAADGEE